MKKTLGLDIGVTSVGWGIIDENHNIIDYGVRLFEELDVAENLTRRSMRGSRRIIRRRKQRILDLKTLLVKNNIISENFVTTLDPYILRKKGLKEKLTNEELATVLLNLVKRRGSSLETIEEGKDGESTKTTLFENQKALDDDNYIVNVQLDRLENKGKIRGSKNVFKTVDYVKEVKAILQNQNLSEELNRSILDIVTRRRHFSEGPGSLTSPSPYGRYREVTGDLRNEIIEEINKNHQSLFLKEKFEINYDNKDYIVFKNGKIVNKEKYDLIALMKGKCSVFPEEYRAPKNAFSAELFNFLNDLNNLTFTSRENQKITKEEKEKVIEVIREKGNITIIQLLKLLNEELVNVTGFRIKGDDVPIISEFNGYKKILKIVKDLNIKMLEDNTIDQIMEILTETVVEEERLSRLEQIVDNVDLTIKLSQLTGVNQYHSLSLKALRLLNDEMLIESKNQQQIITEQNLNVKSKTNKLVQNESAILSPTAKRAHREALKVVESLTKEHGNFDKIIIETTRDKNTAEQRKKIKDNQNKNEKYYDEAKEIIGDYGDENVTRRNVQKIRLYKEQNGKCAYSGKSIDIATLIRDARAYEIDHIIPLSISFDDSYNNKVLVLPSENQSKRNRTPFAYFQSGDVKQSNPINSWDKFEKYVLGNTNYNRFKKQNLLFMKDINKFDVMKEFINRNIVDTSYAIRSLMTTLKDYFQSNDINTKVLTIKGKQTNLFRKVGRNNWFMTNPKELDSNNPFIKDRERYIHHAVDALIIAGLANQKTMQSLYNLVLEDDHTYNRYTGEIIDPTNDTLINKYLNKIGEIEESQVKFSWKIDSKINRRVSDQTIYSTRAYDGEHYVIKKISDIYELKKDEIYNFIYGKNRGKLLISKHDPKSYEILVKAYEQYKTDKYPFKSYLQEHGPLRKYSKNNKGPEIKQLKYQEDKLGNHIDITQDQSSDKKVVLLQIKPYRADIYYSEETGLYKFVTIRHRDLSKIKDDFYINEEWYNSEKQNKNIDNTYRFLFSLNRNNIVKITRKNQVSEEYRFTAVNNDHRNIIEFNPINYYYKNQLTVSIGSSIIKLEKYNVSITGKYSKVIKEDLKLIF